MLELKHNKHFIATDEEFLMRLIYRQTGAKKKNYNIMQCAFVAILKDGIKRCIAEQCFIANNRINLLFTYTSTRI